MYIDKVKCKKVFAEYVKNYNSDDGKIKLKITHTYNVCDVCTNIAKRLNLSDDDINIAFLLGLLHDIGRFEQIRRYGTFNDSESINHAKLGAEILFKDGKIRYFIDDDSEDELIKSAILYHNMYEIPEGISERIMLFSKILRDADKIDIFRVNVVDPAEDVYGYSKESIITSSVSTEVLESFKKFETVPRALKKTPVDNVVCHIAFIFGIYFSESLDIINEQGYFEKLINFKSKDENARKSFENIRQIVKLYMSKREEEV